MKYCLKWNNKSLLLDNADEISISYIEDKGLIKFMEKYAGKRIVIRLKSTDFSNSEINKLKAINKKLEYKFTVAIPEKDIQLANKLKEEGIPFYFLTPVQNWEELNYYVRTLGVSDINICGPLGFELPKVRKFLNKYGANVIVRATPNVATAITEECPPLQKFFIRPDDIDLYEPYIDVLEFAGIELQDVFYNIYAKDKTFMGRLNQVIYGIEEPYDNLGLIPQFAARRIECGRECLSGGHCQRCETLVSVSKKVSPHILQKIKEKFKK